MEITAEIRQWIEQQSLAAGFDQAGIAAVPELASPEAKSESTRFATWVQSGHAAEMGYLKRAGEDGDLLRGALRRAMPWARSVIVCTVNYNAAAPRSIDPAEPGKGWIARYAWSGDSSGSATDYHDVMLPKLKVLEAALRRRLGDTIDTRCYVDTGPVVERVYAQRAGIGWIGKNTCLLNQQLGSWMLLGVIVTSLPLEQEAWSVPATDRCGSCTRCIDACPTDALVVPRQMDASRCIAYLTIEHKGSIAEHLREPIGRQVFGCDICQDVCPWNRRAPLSHEPIRTELVNPALDWLAAMDAAEFKRWFAGSPLERTKRKRLHRNVAIAMGNSGDPGFVPKLEEWSTSDDPVLADSARWAIQQLTGQ